MKELMKFIEAQAALIKEVEELPLDPKHKELIMLKIANMRKALCGCVVEHEEIENMLATIFGIKMDS